MPPGPPRGTRHRRTRGRTRRRLESGARRGLRAPSPARSRAYAVGADEGRHLAMPTAERPKILVVDDREDTLFAMESALAPLRYPLDRAGTGDDALKAVLRGG